jgi:hypothetical protein
MASTYLTRTTGTPTNGKKYTWSVWTKINPNSSAHNYLFSEYRTGNDRDEFAILSASNDNFRWESLNSGNNVAYFQTNRVFRDCNAWYHFVFAYDSTLATSTDRWKFYVNGVQETSFSASMYPAQNAEGSINISGITQNIGQRGGSYGYLDGSMSHMHFIDGTAYDATAFGEYDANGVWKIKTDVSVTYGNNGFFILKDGNSVTDQSGNSNNFTVAGGTLTNTEDNPSNVFATLNPLGSAAVTFSKGNLEITQSGTSWLTGIGSIGASSGKFYGECKVISQPSGTNDIFIGIVNLDKSNLQNTTQHMGEDAYSAAIFSNGGEIYYNSGTQFYSGDGSYSTNAIIQLAMDLDNGFLYWGVNGTWQNSANPTSGATGTGGMAISNLSANGTYTFGAAIVSSAVVSFNFGNGYFGTTAVSSAGTNASGIGIFEYDVPTGYTALSTKGLNL